MAHAFDPRRLDPQAFARAGGELAGSAPLSAFARLAEVGGAAHRTRPVRWQARGEMRSDAAATAQVWLHLRASVSLPLVCQRCLEPVDTEVACERDFRFVAGEAQAEAEDAQAEEDVLALSRDFDLLGLVEDELLMALPLVPRHAVCPQPVSLAVQDPGFEAAQAAKPQPFAALAGLKQSQRRR